MHDESSNLMWPFSICEHQTRANSGEARERSHGETELVQVLKMNYPLAVKNGSTAIELIYRWCNQLVSQDYSSDMSSLDASEAQVVYKNGCLPWTNLQLVLEMAIPSRNRIEIMGID